MNPEQRQEVFNIFRESGEASFTVFMTKLEAKYEEYENVIDAEDLFNEKRKEDDWWKKALQRINNLGKIIREKDEE